MPRPDGTPVLPDRLRALIRIAKLRWCIERDSQELQQELGPGHDEGRGWRGFSHRAALCIAAYGFLVAERAAFPPPRPDSGSRHLACPVVSGCGARPARAERHSPHSLATLRARLVEALVRRLSYCPCYRQPTTPLRT